MATLVKTKNNAQVPHINKNFLYEHKIQFYKDTINDNQLNDKQNVPPNKIFETIIKSESHNGYTLNTPPAFHLAILDKCSGMSDLNMWRV
jgi:hypothetical protein